MDCNVETFPKNQQEAIAMLYAEKAVSNGCSPEEASKVYWDAYTKAGSNQN